MKINFVSHPLDLFLVEPLVRIRDPQVLWELDPRTRIVVLKKQHVVHWHHDYPQVRVVANTGSVVTIEWLFARKLVFPH